jgi:gas vesicle protein
MVGAGLTLMLSPVSGAGTRRRLSDLKEDLMEKKDEYADEAKERVKDTLQKGKDYVEKKKSVVGAAVEAGREAYEKEKEKHEKT